MEQKLFMVLLGCKPEGRNIEQHDIFFGISDTLTNLIPKMEQFWPNVKLHIDAWRTVERIENYKIEVLSKNARGKNKDLSLFFINLGAYKIGEFQELHKNMLIVAKTKDEAIRLSKNDKFYMVDTSNLSPSAITHVDDKYEVDDVINISEQSFCKIIIRNHDFLDDTTKGFDKINLGFLPFSKLR